MKFFRIHKSAKPAVNRRVNRKSADPAPQKAAPGGDRREAAFWVPAMRLYLLLGLLLLMCAAVLAKATMLQIVQGERLAGLAKQEYRQTITLTPSRGVIYDRNRNELAVSVMVDSVYARPGEVKEADKSATKLAKVLHMSRRKVKADLTSTEPFVWLKRQVSPQTAQLVSRLRLPGVAVVPETKRYYPHRELAAHLLGFTGLDAQGLEGLEKAFETKLKGRTTRVTRMRDASGRAIYDRSLGAGRISDGHDLVLTIDKRIQHLTEQALAAGCSKWRAKGGMAVVMDPTSGQILAMTVWPTFNPNIFARYPKEVWRNRCLTDAFEPGSTAKVFTVAAAIEDGLFSPNTVVNCESGAYRIGGAVIHDVKAKSQLTVAEVLILSSNIGAAKIGLALGRKRLGRYLHAFGFGKVAGVEAPGETPGLVRNPGGWRTVETAAAAFGHGLSVNAVQLTAAMAAVANDGVLMRPFLVRDILDDQGRLVHRTRPTQAGRPISAKTARIIKSLMEQAVDEGTGHRAALNGYTTAGKTGTTRKIVDGAYTADKHQALFVGFAPADKPALVMTVIIDEPQGAYYGGVVAAPVFAEAAQQILPLLGASPDDENLRRVETAPVAEPSRTAGAEKPSSKGPRIALVKSSAGRETVETTTPQAATGADPAATKTGTMPPLIGLPLRQALKVIASLGLKAKVAGSGYVVSQQPRPGSGLSGVNACSIQLKGEVS